MGVMIVPGKVWTPLSYLMIFGLLGGVYFLPADTSLREVQRGGLLRACMPPLYPPLVTGDPQAPGIDIELLRALAEGLGLTFAITPNPVMGQDFNPRNWRVKRAQCEVLAGGVVASPVTRSFLETSPSYAETGWGFVLPKPVGNLQGQRAIVLTGISGLDRIALSGFLRAKNVEFAIASSAADMTLGLREGRFDVGVTEMLQAGLIAAREGWTAEWAPPELPRFPVVLGLWKGDLTLKRAIVDGFSRLESSGELAKIMARYRGDKAKS
jgi:polar amino acid transport system substrate-binding protein/cystine transport system substrate-binding protein/membrane-bound lytic murein transglycosylase F